MKLVTLAIAAALTLPAFPTYAEHAECPSLRARLKSIDAQARKRSTESLTKQRRQVKERLYELGCSEMG